MMKNNSWQLLFFTLIIACSISCGSNTQSEASDTDCVAADKAAIDIGYHGIDNSSSVTSDVILPVNGSCGSIISWNSDNNSIISNAGIVTRPGHGSGNMTVILTAMITKYPASDTRTFTLTVIEQSESIHFADIGFESGTLPSLFDNVITGPGSALEISDEQKIFENFSLKYKSAGSVDAYLVKTFASQDLIYARAYIRLKTGFDMRAGNGDDTCYNGIAILSLLDSSGRELVAAKIDNESPPIMLWGSYSFNTGVHEFKTYPDGTGDTQAVNLAAETTYCIEVYYSYGNGTGTAGIICNGVNFASITGLVNDGCIPDRVRIGAVSLYGDYATSGSVIYFDNLIISSGLD